MQKIEVGTEDTERGFKAIDKEVEVFEKPEYAEIDREACQQQQLPSPGFVAPVNSSANGKIGDCRNRQQETEAPVPVAIEEVTYEQQEEIFMFFPRQ